MPVPVFGCRTVLGSNSTQEPSHSQTVAYVREYVGG